MPTKGRSFNGALLTFAVLLTLACPATVAAAAAAFQTYLYVATGQVTYVASDFNGLRVGEPAYWAIEFTPPAGVDPFTEKFEFWGYRLCEWGTESGCAVALRSNLRHLNSTGDGYLFACDVGQCRYDVSYDIGEARLSGDFEWRSTQFGVRYSGIITAHKMLLAPEPSTVLMLGSSILGLAATWRRRVLKPSR